MPYYDYQCNKCDKEFEIFKSIKERNDVEDQCDQGDCDLQLKIGVVQMSYDNTNLSGRKPDENFRDVLKEIKKSHPNGNVNTW